VEKWLGGAPNSGKAFDGRETFDSFDGNPIFLENWLLTLLFLFLLLHRQQDTMAEQMVRLPPFPSAVGANADLFPVFFRRAQAKKLWGGRFTEGTDPLYVSAGLRCGTS
jgi:hypothetical protein